MPDVVLVAREEAAGHVQAHHLVAALPGVVERGDEGPRHVGDPGELGDVPGVLVGERDQPEGEAPDAEGVEVGDPGAGVAVGVLLQDEVGHRVEAAGDEVLDGGAPERSGGLAADGGLVGRVVAGVHRHVEAVHAAGVEVIQVGGVGVAEAVGGDLDVDEAAAAGVLDQGGQVGRIVGSPPVKAISVKPRAAARSIPAGHPLGGEGTRGAWPR